MTHVDTPAGLIERAKGQLQAGDYAAAQSLALIAIAELMATNVTDLVLDATTRGAVAATEAIGSIFSVINPGGPIPGTGVEE